MSGDAPLVSGISCHAWNGDKSMIALSPNSNEVWIYSTPSNDPSTWERKHVLKEHDQHVSSIDWCGATNKIVSCSHDRNAYVWSLVDGTWKPGLVILRINRAATSVRWSPDGTKFAVASGAKVVPICHFEGLNDWWVSRMIKKHKSTVLDVAWHPNSKYVVTASSDFKCRVFSAFIDEVDAPKNIVDNLSAVWPKHDKFGECLLELDTSRGWVTSVSWSPSGEALAFAGQDSSVSFVSLANNTINTSHISTPDLPYRKIMFLSDKALVAGSYDCKPYLFALQGDQWKMVQCLDEAKTDGAQSSGDGFSNIRKQFQNLSNRGGTGADVEDRLASRHQNTITGLAKYSEGGAVFTTSGIDGRLLFWDLKALGVDTASLGLN